MLARIDLRMARNPGNTGGSDSAISVARLKIPAKAKDRYRKAAQAFLRGDFDQADKTVNQSLAIYPDNPEALTLRGLVAWHNKDAPAAIEDFQKSMDVDPSYVPAYTSMSSVFNSQGKYDDAARTTERALAVNPNAWQGYFELSKSMLGKRMYDKALQMANHAEALAPDGLAVIHLLKAYALVPQNLYKDAATELQAFLSHAPKGQDISEVKVLLVKVHAAEAAAVPNSSVTSGFALVSH
jgi:tetratricopeptide (TPR) repeat protein